MTGLVWVLFAILPGCLLVYRFAHLERLTPRWAATLLILGVGTAVGIGLTSCSFLFWRLLIPGVPRLPMWVETAVVTCAFFVVLRKWKWAVTDRTSNATSGTSPLRSLLVMALVVVTCAMSRAWNFKPEGEWDAWCIWNLRAHFLAAGGDLASRAWSPMLGYAHPEYPLLLSAFVARGWVYSGSTLSSVPIATSYLFLLSLVALAAGGLTILRRSDALGALLGLALLGTPTFVYQVPAQYADIPLACYLAASIVLTILDRPRLAGLLAGFAAWTKDEGLLFLAALVIAAGLFRRHQILRLTSAALPLGAVSCVSKALNGTVYLSSTSFAGLFEKLSDLSRYTEVISASADQFMRMAVSWYHPLLPLLLLVVVLRFERERYRDLLFSGTVCIVLVLGYFTIYVVTPYNLPWHLNTSLYRIFVQIWPLLLLTSFVALRSPEDAIKVRREHPT